MLLADTSDKASAYAVVSDEERIIVKPRLSAAQNPNGEEFE
jgi:hypothetical protein